MDSIQTMRTAEGSQSIGSVSQIRESTARVVQFAKSTGVAVVLVGHVTKAGDVAGPKILEHMVDTVLCLEGSEKTDYRMVRCEKNRFGSISEVGVFTMTEDGMKDVANPSELFLTNTVIKEALEGSAVVIVIEGSKPILAEVQCLVSTTYSSPTGGKINPRRAADGFPLQRLLLICAVIEKRLRLAMWSSDVYLNVVGGLRIAEPTADLAVAMALISSYTTTPIHPATAFIGELGLGGELRGGKKTDLKVNEAIKLGFKRIILPASSGFKLTNTPADVTILPCANLKAAVKAALSANDIDAVLYGNKRKKGGDNTETNPYSGGSSNSSANDSYSESESETGLKYDEIEEVIANN